jgi:hypothetical protein
MNDVFYTVEYRFGQFGKWTKLAEVSYPSIDDAILGVLAINRFSSCEQKLIKYELDGCDIYELYELDLFRATFFSLNSHFRFIKNINPWYVGLSYV